MTAEAKDIRVDSHEESPILWRVEVEVAPKRVKRAFDRAYKALVQRDAAQRRAVDTNDTADVRASANASAGARSAWNEIHNLTEDPRARAIADLFLKQGHPVAGYVKPLDRWAGGSIVAPGKGTYRDYPDVFVGVFPST